MAQHYLDWSLQWSRGNALSIPMIYLFTNNMALADTRFKKNAQFVWSIKWQGIYGWTWLTSWITLPKLILDRTHSDVHTRKDRMDQSESIKILSSLIKTEKILKSNFKLIFIEYTSQCNSFWDNISNMYMHKSGSSS